MILLLTHSGDYYTVDRVKATLDEASIENAIVHTDRFPSHSTLSTLYSNDGPGRVRGELADQKLDNHPIDLGRVTAVWNRRLWPGMMPPDLPPETLIQNHELCKHTFKETIALLDHAYWMNPVHAGLMAESKPLQLKLANEIGMRIPETLISNDPARIRKFFHRCDGNLITKTLLPLAVSMTAAPDLAYTCRVESSQLDQLEIARLSPQIYQPFVEKRWELRVAVVGETFFVAGIRKKGGDPPGIDWRAPGEGEMEWFPAELDDSTRRKTLELMKRLGIVYGSADFIVDDPDKEPVFLEINQAGEWGMLERDLGFPIAATIAQNLIDNRCDPA